MSYEISTTTLSPCSVRSGWLVDIADDGGEGNIESQVTEVVYTFRVIPYTEHKFSHVGGRSFLHIFKRIERTSEQRHLHSIFFDSQAAIRIGIQHYSIQYPAFQSKILIIFLFHYLSQWKPSQACQIQAASIITYCYLHISLLFHLDI